MSYVRDGTLHAMNDIVYYFMRNIMYDYVFLNSKVFIRAI